MEQAAHGGNIFEISQKLGLKPDDIIDLSASINPLGPPKGLKEEISKHFKLIAHYPDIHNKELINAISEFHNISPANIAVGNGSTEILYWLPYAMEWQRVALVLPTFSEYSKVLYNKKAIVRKLICSWDSGFQPTVEQLDALIHSSRPDAVFLTHPGSPSGVPLSEKVMEFIVSNSKDNRFYWVLDEVFIDFSEQLSLKEYVDDSRKIIIIRSLTKFYSLPGIRLGYILAPAGVIRKLNNFIPPWSVNTLAQIAGKFCLKDASFREKTYSFFNKEIPRVIDKLKAIPNIEVLPSIANYVLIRISKDIPINSYMLCENILTKHKILVRNCANFEGLNEKYVRIAVHNTKTNDIWIQALKEELTQEEQN